MENLRLRIKIERDNIVSIIEKLHSMVHRNSGEPPIYLLMNESSFSLLYCAIGGLPGSVSKSAMGLLGKKDIEYRGMQVIVTTVWITSLFRGKIGFQQAMMLL